MTKNSVEEEAFKTCQWDSVWMNRLFWTKFKNSKPVPPTCFNWLLICENIYGFCVPLHGFLLKNIAVAPCLVTENHMGNLFTPLSGVSNGDLSVNAYGSLGIAISLELISTVHWQFELQIKSVRFGFPQNTNFLDVLHIVCLFFLTSYRGELSYVESYFEFQFLLCTSVYGCSSWTYYNGDKGCLDRFSTVLPFFLPNGQAKSKR